MERPRQIARTREGCARFGPGRGFAVLVVAVLMGVGLAPSGRGDKGEDNGPVGTGRQSADARLLVGTIADQFPALVSRDTNGHVIALGLPSQYKDAHSISLICEIPSLRKLKIYGTPWVGTPVLTEASAKLLTRMTNVTSLSFDCFQQGLKKGVLVHASSMKQLEEFRLYFSDAPPGDYKYLKSMTNLTTLSIQWCKGFGDQQATVLTNLPRLRTLQLVATGLSPEGTNVLSACHALTNIWFAP